MRNFRSKAVAAPLAAIALIMGGSLAIAAPDLGLPGADKPVVAPHPTNTHAPKPTDEPTQKPTEEPTPAPTPTEEPGNRPADEPLTGPNPSIHGLCNAYQAGAYAHSTKNGTKVNPAWRSLELAAGGPAMLETFCAAELAKPKPVDDSEVRPENSDKASKPDKLDEDKAPKPDKAEKSDKVEKAPKPDKGDKPDKG